MIVFPEVQVEEYASTLEQLVFEMQKEVARRAGTIIEKYNKFLAPEEQDIDPELDPEGVEERLSQNQQVQDVDDPEVKRELEEIRQSVKQELDEDNIRDIVAANINNIQSVVNTQFEATFEQQVGVQPLRNNARLRSFVQQEIERNVNLIKTLPDRHFEQIQDTVETAIQEGWTTEKLQKEIPRAGATNRFNAERIARDQAGNVSGEITQQRFQDAGLRKFEWQTVGDNRVREDHQQLNGEIFTWKEGAPRSLSPSGFPGKDIQCRCVAGLVREEVNQIARAG